MRRKERQQAQQEETLRRLQELVPQKQSAANASETEFIPVTKESKMESSNNSLELTKEQQEALAELHRARKLKLQSTNSNANETAKATQNQDTPKQKKRKATDAFNDELMQHEDDQNMHWKDRTLMGGRIPRRPMVVGFVC